MRGRIRLYPRHVLLPTVLGLADGILTAVTLAAGELTENDPVMTLNRALRIAVGALVSGVFVFYVAQYSQLRGELVHAERQLNLLSHGRLASTRLGQSVQMEAIWTAVISSSASFVGALIPLLTGVLFPSWRWVAIASAVISLGFLGLALARVVHGSYLRWCLSLVVGGILLSAIGIELHIV